MACKWHEWAVRSYSLQTCHVTRLPKYILSPTPSLQMNAQGHSYFQCLLDLSLLCDHNLTLLPLQAGCYFSAEAFPDWSTWGKPERSKEEDTQIYVKEPMPVTSTMEMKPSCASRGLSELSEISSLQYRPSLKSLHIYVYIHTWIIYIFAYWLL